MASGDTGRSTRWSWPSQATQGGDAPVAGCPDDAVGSGVTAPRDQLLPGRAGGDGKARLASVRRQPWSRIGAGRARRPGPGEQPMRPRPGWYAYRPDGTAELPAWAIEVALTIERPVDGQIQALALFRAPTKVRWLAGIVAAVAEVERAAGLRAVTGLDPLTGARVGIGSGLLVGPALPGLVPVPATVAWTALAAAGARGLPVPLRRRWPVAGGTELSWRSGAGSVVTCDGPCGLSAQAVVAVSGPPVTGLGGTLGDGKLRGGRLGGGRLGGDVGGGVAGITPPPGGALVLRAWRARRSWGVSCGLVLGAAAALGLGREAARAAAGARDAGWDAVVLRGSAALDLARAGSPSQPAPADAARAATSSEVAALFETCLAAGGLGPQAAGARGLRVTP